jgi:hypothetical protein
MRSRYIKRFSSSFFPERINNLNISVQPNIPEPFFSKKALFKIFLQNLGNQDLVSDFVQFFRKYFFVHKILYIKFYVE